jgi:hypothetical protein
MLKAAYYNLVAAARHGTGCHRQRANGVAVAIGGCKLKGNLLLHVVFALSAGGMIWLLCVWRSPAENYPTNAGIIYISFALAAVLLIAIAGHVGGILSGVESGATLIMSDPLSISGVFLSVSFALS